MAGPRPTIRQAHVDHGLDSAEVYQRTLDQFRESMEERERLEQDQGLHIPRLPLDMGHSVQDEDEEEQGDPMSWPQPSLNPKVTNIDYLELVEQMEDARILGEPMGQFLNQR